LQKTATRQELEPRTVDRLHELMQVNVDSAKGFRQAASITDNPTLRSMFRDLARQRARFAEELRSQVPSNADRTPTEGTWVGKAHRWWMDVRSKMALDAGYSMLAEVERAEDRIKAAYEELGNETLGSPVRPLLQAQYEEVRSIHDRIRDMRDAALVRKSR